MTRTLLALPLCLVVVVPASAQTAKDAVKKVEAVFEPAEAKPGQTVTLKITVELADGYYTYPTVQPAPEGKYSTNSVVFPIGGPIVFVDKTVDPAGPKTKKVEDYDLFAYPGGGTWIRKAVVSTSAKPGATSAKVKFKLLVCEEDRCFPPKTHELEATLKVLDGPPVDVDPKYKAEVEKAEKK
jgi:DsbC/DsbD-like thiol-disulfide interchange protein